MRFEITIGFFGGIDEDDLLDFIFDFSGIFDSVRLELLWVGLVVFSSGIFCNEVRLGVFAEVGVLLEDLGPGPVLPEMEVLVVDAVLLKVEVLILEELVEALLIFDPIELSLLADRDFVLLPSRLVPSFFPYFSCSNGRNLFRIRLVRCFRCFPP
jgi:hypothetical protein